MSQITILILMILAVLGIWWYYKQYVAPFAGQSEGGGIAGGGGDAF